MTPTDRTRPQAIGPVPVEILPSIEPARGPAAVGATGPPSGVRGAASRPGGTDRTHGPTRPGAAVVTAVARVIDDLAHGRIPTIPAERGILSARGRDRAGAAGRAGFAVAVEAPAAAPRDRGAHGRCA